MFLEKNCCDLSYKINNIFNLNFYKTQYCKEDIQIEKDEELRNIYNKNISNHRHVVKIYK